MLAMIHYCLAAVLKGTGPNDHKLKFQKPQDKINLSSFNLICHCDGKLTNSIVLLCAYFLLYVSMGEGKKVGKNVSQESELKKIKSHYP
jgi:hypothetical protein